MAGKSTSIQRIPDEENDAYSDDSLFNITSWGADLSFRDLLYRYDHDELVKPELQRHYVWDRTEASRFIDSVLLGLPVPSIFLAKTSDEKMLIVDGFQRIMTVNDFVRGIFSRDGKIFRLSRTEKIHSKWRGKAFTELAESEQRRILGTTIHSIIFVQQHPTDDDTSLFQVFERINTSGRTLLPQEIRNCVAQGSMNKLLFSLNSLENWRELFGTIQPDPRMRDMEYILRFFALISDSFLKDTRERISLKRFLDIFMKENANPDSSRIEVLKNEFTSSIELVYSVFGESAFQNVSPSDPNRLVKKFSPTIFDSITIAAHYAIDSGNYKIPRDAESARRQLLLDPVYKFSISQETMTRGSIGTRIEKAAAQLFGVTL